ncbi:hypothetical protein CIHG_08184 [Coccidioides immitis H538.4]|uniref:DUF2415 domain-containing protein n=1 Tax=Coccidioides immitis H538.4 TaxID=396776 RepID=A0A0J8S1W9_COCIT|nr:hypothetical protein CIHG_08184 [Coccidioides immitis H538.4]
MTLDSALLHHQLRHYISTSDPDRIYVAVGRIIYTIHISSRKREIITVIPFEPKCLTAGLGWIGIGGSKNGDCAFIKLGDSGITSPRTRAAALDADIDSPLPLDLDPPLRRLPPRAPGNSFLSNPRQDAEFGGSIVNSVTLHRLPAPREGLDHEDVAVLSNNDKTEMLETIRHPICMNYAIISPDSKVLAAVGDANQIWFYHVRPITDEHGPVQDGDKLLSEWKWPLIKKVDLDSDPHYDDQCCFTIAFSPCSSLCAVGSQGGIITIFDMNSILNVDLEGYKAGEEVLCPSLTAARSAV